MKKQTKICLNAMAGNEERVIERMLKSCYQYIDYWVIQCNGNDNTQKIIEDFFADKNIPGFTYNHEWDYPGINRDHTLQTALSADHGCDWILRMDADEQLEVDEDFDWTPINDTRNQCFNVPAKSPGSVFYRNWFWNAKLPWRFNHDKRHETIYLADNTQHIEYNLPVGFRQVLTNDGVTWTNPTKFFTDAVELENDKVSNWTLLDDLYHFWYIGKSYNDATYGSYPFGEAHMKEYARRAIFYFEQYLNYRWNYSETNKAPYLDEMGYSSLHLMSDMYRLCGDYEKAIDCAVRAEEFCPRRNEHIVSLAETYRKMGDFKSMKEQTERLVDPERKLPFPDFYFLINTNFYIDSGGYGKHLHQIACDNYK